VTHDKDGGNDREIARPRPWLLFWALILRTGVFRVSLLFQEDEQLLWYRNPCHIRYVMARAIQTEI